MKKIRKMLLLVAVLAIGCFALAACGSGSGGELTYDSIYSEYSAKLTENGATLLDEYNSEAAGISDVTQLATLANEKVAKLAEIQVEGGTKMAELMEKNGDEYSVYQENFNKLYQVYNDESMKIYTAYIDKYADTIPGMTDALKQQMLDSLAAGLEAMAPISGQ